VSVRFLAAQISWNDKYYSDNWRLRRRDLLPGKPLITINCKFLNPAPSNPSTEHCPAQQLRRHGPSEDVPVDKHQLVATHSHPAAKHGPNLGSSERALSIAIGVTLLANGFRTGGVGGILQVSLGALGLIRGASGHCAVKKALTHTPFEEAFQQEHGWKNSEAVSRSITIGKPRGEVFAFMKKPQNIGDLIPWVETVEWTGDTSSRWTATPALGRKMQCNLQLQEQQPDSLLRWDTGPESMWQHDISVHFNDAPAGRGTEVKAVIVGKPAMGKIGYAASSAIALFTDKALLHLLHSVKQQLETGEVSTNNMQPDPSPDFFYLHPHTAASSTVQGSSAEAVKTGIALEGGNL
jgi:uncharacterized membrane protein